MQNIHPIFSRLISRKKKEERLAQKSLVVWLIGLSGSGKSTLAHALENSLFEKGYHTVLLDGDNLRSGLNNNLGFENEDRVENIRRAAEVAKLFANNGTITICSLISPTRSIRKMAREIIGEDYFQVFVNCPLEVCEERDVKGLYKKARAGEIRGFTGIDSPFEEPTDSDLEIKTDQLTEMESLELLLAAVLPRIENK